MGSVPTTRSYLPGDDLSGSTYTGTGSKTYITKTGLLPTVAAGVPRDNHYIGITRTYLTEAAGTNILPGPTLFATWSTVVTGATLDRTQTTDGPDGVAGSATVVTHSAIAAGQSIRLWRQPPQANGPVTWSVWLRGATGSEVVWISLTTNDTIAGGWVTVPCVLTNTWQRYHVTATRSGVDLKAIVGVTPLDTNQGTRPAQTFHIADGQLENQGFASSYIPAGTRGGESLVIPAPIVPAESTYYLRYVDQGLSTMQMAGDRFLFTYGGSTNNRLTVKATNVPAFNLNYKVGGTDHFMSDPTGGTIVFGDTVEIRVTLTVAGVASISHSVNGGTETTPVSSGAVAFPAAWDQGTMEFGSSGGILQAPMAIVAFNQMAGIQSIDACRTANPNPPPTATDNVPNSVVMLPLSFTLVQGQTVQMSAKVMNLAGTDITAVSPVTYSSQNTAVLTVTSPAGLVTAVGPGTTTVTVTTANGKTDTSPGVITADTTVLTVTVSPTTVNLLTGATTTVTATAKNVFGIPLSGIFFSWASSAPAVASVSPTGVVTALAAGTTTISATSGGVTGTTTIVVSVPAVDTVPATCVVSPAPFTLLTGQTIQLAATVRNAATTVLSSAVAPVTWSSSAPAVAIVSATGLVTGVTAGTVVITAQTSVPAVNGSSTGTLSVPVVPVGYSISTPHWPHMRRQWTDFGFHYRANYLTDPTIQVEIAKKASRMDMIMAGKDALWNPCKSNPTIQHIPYCTLFTSLVGGAGADPATVFSSATAGVGHAAAYATANGFDVEELFLHYYSGQGKEGTYKTVGAITATNPVQLTVTAHGFTNGATCEFLHGDGKNNIPLPTFPDGNYVVTVIDANTISLPVANTVATSKGKVSVTLGDGTATLANRLTRTIFGSSRHSINPSAAHAPAYHANRLTPLVASEWGLFVDEADSTQYADPFSSYNPPIMSREYPMRGMTLANQATVSFRYATDTIAVIAAVRGANANKRLQMNTSAYFFAQDRRLGAAGGAMQCEQALNSASYGNINSFLTFATNCLADGTLVVAVDSIFWANPTDTPPGDASPSSPDAHLYSDFKHRWKMFSYISYLLGMPQSAAGQNLWYFDDNNGQWQQPQNAWWLTAAEVMIGHPIAPRVATTISSNVADGQAPDPLVYRHFDNGLVVNRFNNTAASNRNTATATWTLPTDRNYYRVLDDGVIPATPSLTVDLNRAEGALFYATNKGVPAKRADSFARSIGFNFHFDYGSTPYGLAWQTLMLPRLREMGLKTIRGGCMDASNNGPLGNMIEANYLTGVKYILVSAKANDAAAYTDMSRQANTFAHLPSSSMLMVEGPNEVDNNNGIWGGVSAYAANVSTFEQSLQNLMLASTDPVLKALPRATPSVTSNVGATTGNPRWDSFCAYGTAHPYSWAVQPEPPLAGNILAVSPMWGGVGNRPVVATETGYFTAVNAPQPWYTVGLGVSELAQMKYTLRLLVEYFRYGIVYTTLYEFIDEGTDQTFAENSFGVQRFDGTKKPAFDAIKNMIALTDETPYTPPVWTVTRGGYVTDTFTRANQTGLGTAPTGTDSALAYVDGDGNNAQWKIVSNHAETAVNFQVRTAVGDVHSGGIEDELWVDTFVAGSNQLLRLYSRYNQFQNAYAFDVNPSQPSQLQLTKFVGGTQTTLTYQSKNLSSATQLALKLQVVPVGNDNWIKAKTWDTSGAEPSTWDLSYIDFGAATGVLASGQSAFWITNSNAQKIHIRAFYSGPVTVTPPSQAALPPLVLGQLDYTITGTNIVASTLLQKPDGFYLWVYQQVSVWNQTTKTDITNADVTATLTIRSGGPKTVTTYKPSTGLTGTARGTGTTITFPVPDEPILVKIS